MMVQLAYGVPDWKIAGGPTWADSFAYDIKGTFPAGVGAFSNRRMSLKE